MHTADICQKTAAAAAPPLAVTLSGDPIPPVVAGLPKNTQSLCPECLAVISAREYEKDGKVFMTKTCAEHGTFNDIVSSDVRIFQEIERWHFRDGQGFSEPQVSGAAHCPSSCGICNQHVTHTAVANIDLTGKCNLSCNICFADSNTSRYEPSLAEITQMLQRLRATKPAPCTTVQYTGGEPSVHPDFFDIVRTTRELGFTHIQVATNGLKFADPDFAAQARDVGLQYLYLQMDGVTDDVYEKIRGRKLFDVKMQVIESARKAGLRIIFVPTILRGVNDHQIGDLIRLAFDNLDVLTGISFQPIVFTGRYPEDHRLRERYTLADMMLDVGRQTGMADPYTDWFSLNSGAPFAHLAESLTGNPVSNHTCHPHCGAMSLMFVDKHKNAVPVTRFLDLYAALKDIDSLAASTGKTWFKMFSQLKTLNVLHRHFRADQAPEGLSFMKFLQTLDGYSDKKYSWSDEYRGHTYKTFFLFGMHFMDAYNYDLQRIRRCAVHYSAPDGKLYPFCTYNSGHTFRTRVEREYAASIGN